MGNLIPGCVWFVTTLLGIRVILHRHELIGRGLWILVLADVLGWVALNQFGLFQNGRMRRRLSAIVGKSKDLPADRSFVGFSSPKFAGILDAHEDVGFLYFGDSEITFRSETRSVDLERTEIRKICFRPNVHSIVGLGRWISIEGVRHGKPIRMLIEPRERRTMLGNLLESRKLRAKLGGWWKQTAQVGNFALPQTPRTSRG
jgi:hypothetical protein